MLPCSANESQVLCQLICGFTDSFKKHCRATRRKMTPLIYVLFKPNCFYNADGSRSIQLPE